MRHRWIAPIAIVIQVVAAACGSDTPPEEPAPALPTSRSEAVASLVDLATPQRFDVLADDAVHLVEQAKTWCSVRGAGADAAGAATSLEAAAVAVRHGWASLAPFGFGPITQRRSRLLVDFPISATGVAETLAGDQPVDAVSQRELGAADERGLGVVFELIDGGSDTDATDLDRRCDYLVGAVDLVADEIRGVADEWATYGPASVGDADSVDTTLQDLVSEAAFSLAMIDPRTETVDTSRARLRGVGAVFFPSDDAGGIGALLGDGTLERLRTALEAALADPTPDAAMAVEAIVRTDVVAELSLSLNFSDADGDG